MKRGQRLISCQTNEIYDMTNSKYLHVRKLLKANKNYMSECKVGIVKIF